MPPLTDSAAAPPLDDGIWPLPPDPWGGGGGGWRGGVDGKQRRYTVVDNVIILASEAAAERQRDAIVLVNDEIRKMWQGRRDVLPVEEFTEVDANDARVDGTFELDFRSFDTLFVFLFVPYLLVFVGCVSFSIFEYRVSQKLVSPLSEKVRESIDLCSSL